MDPALAEQRWDVVIAGAGAAGLCLAVALQRHGYLGRVLVVDDGSRPAPRAWAFWSHRRELPFPTHSFEQLTVVPPSGATQLALAPYRYLVVDRDGLRSSAAAGTARIVFATGHVDAVIPDSQGAVVTVDGHRLRSTWAFDSVTPASPNPSAWLSFSGREVELPRESPAPDAPVLMDFRTTQRGGLSFVYLLPLPGSPLGHRRILVEHTTFAADQAVAEPQLDTEGVARYLTEVLGLSPETAGTLAPTGEAATRPAARAVPQSSRGHRIERAQLPLSTARAADRARSPVVPLGTSAGLLRASTGYAFSRILRHAEALARSLVRHGDPWHLPPRDEGLPRHHRWLDGVLLDVLATSPAVLLDAYDRLLTQVPAPRLLRFLDGDTTPLEELAIVRALPPAPFVSQVLRRTRRVLA